jgi:hypothetical protein
MARLAPLRLKADKQSPSLELPRISDWFGRDDAYLRRQFVTYGMQELHFHAGRLKIQNIANRHFFFGPQMCPLAAATGAHRRLTLFQQPKVASIPDPKERDNSCHKRI